MAKKVAVVLSGCGVYDGAEIHESVISILALDRAGAEVVFCAPDREQMHVVNHHTGEVADGETRNVRVESARIARGPVLDVAEVNAADLDALMLPGGFGAAKNLCTFAVAGADCEVDEGVAALIREVHSQGKPVAAVCIAPAVLAKVLGTAGPELTIGNDAGTAGALETLGATHVVCPVNEFVVDREQKVITSPAYMLGQSISEVAEGIEKTVATLMELA
ncbi:MAG: isoprenoid biosynthesis glyoxalase ElbB [Thermoanaerobaculales bacterium]|jgi:enhancing lycopene biosynthesis protein 2|nr:isoprenoid biosynthesis glyoxalase ElbB [Thermoanaerobaculales bacterium]